MQNLIKIWGMIKKFLAPCTLGYQGMKIWPLLLNIISLQGNALSPFLFELSYLFKIEGLFLVLPLLVYCIYGAFIASILCITKMVFQFWEQIEARRSHISRICGMRKDFKSIFSRSSHGSLWRVDRGVVLQEQNVASQFSSSLSFDFLEWPPPFACIICIVYRATLSWSALDYPKDWGYHLPCRMNPLTFLKRGWARVLSLFVLHFFTLDQSRWTHVSSWVTRRSIKSPGSSS